MRSIIVCGENFVNDQDTIVASSGSGLKEKVYDQDPDTKWISSGSAEGTEETFEVTFNDRVGAAIARTFDRIILLNHNLAQFSCEYWNGSAWVSIAESVFGAGAPNTATNLLIEMASAVSATKFRIRATNTIGAVAEKNLGEMKVCLFVANLRHLVSIERNDFDDGENYRLPDGSLVLYSNVRKFEGSIKVRDMTLTTWQAIRTLLRTHAWLTLVLHYDHDASEVYEGKSVSQPSETLSRKTALYEVSFSFKER